MFKRARLPLLHSKSILIELFFFFPFYICAECVTPLGMASGAIKDEQITASSVLSVLHAPKFSRISSDKFWSPAMDWSSEPQFLQIDFLRSVRLVRLAFKTVRGLSRVTHYHLMFSHNGQVWRHVNNRTAIQYVAKTGDGETTIKKPVEARFYRFVIDEIETGKKAKDQYVAVKMEWFGCYLQDEAANESESVGQWMAACPLQLCAPVLGFETNSIFFFSFFSL